MFSHEKGNYLHVKCDLFEFNLKNALDALSEIVRLGQSVY